MIPSSFRLGREVIKTLHKLSREVGMSFFVCFVLRLKNREKKENLNDVKGGTVDYCSVSFCTVAGSGTLSVSHLRP